MTNEDYTYTIMIITYSIDLLHAHTSSQAWQIDISNFNITMPDIDLFHYLVHDVKLSLQIRKVYNIWCWYRLLTHFDTRTTLLGWYNWSSDVTHSTWSIVYSHVNSCCKNEKNVSILPILYHKQRKMRLEKYSNYPLYFFDIEKWAGGSIFIYGPQNTSAINRH